MVLKPSLGGLEGCYEYLNVITGFELARKKNQGI